MVGKPTSPSKRDTAETGKPQSQDAPNSREQWSCVARERVAAGLGEEAAQCVDVRSLDKLGGDLFMAAQIAAALALKGVDAEIDDVLRKSPLYYSHEVQRSSTKNAQALGNKKTLNAPFSLSPAQLVCLDSVEQSPLASESVRLHTTSPVDEEVARTALRALVSEHPMLRARFHPQANGHYFQTVTTDVEGSYRVIVHDESETTMEKLEVSATVAAPFDIQKGPVISLHLVNKPNSQLWYLRASPLVVDAVSWRILVPALDQLIQAGNLPVSSHTAVPAYQKWVQHWSKSWRTAHKTIKPPMPKAACSQETQLPWSSGDSTLPSYGIGTLSPEITRQLLDAGRRVLKVGPTDLVLACLFQMLATVQKISVENHGRCMDSQGPNVANTVGRFATLDPVELPLETVESDNILAILQTVKDVRRQSHQRPGRTEQTDARLALSGQESPKDVSFQWLGSDKDLSYNLSLFRATPTATVRGKVPLRLTVPSAHLQVCAWIEDSQLTFRCLHARGATDVQPKAEQLAAALEGLAQKLQGQPSMWTVTDFPLFKGTSSDLAWLMNHLSTALKLSDPHEVEDILPCVSMQHGMLMAQLRDEMEYTTHWVWRVVAPAGELLNLERLKTAWQKVVQRHSALRTMIVTDEEKGAFYQLTMKTLTAQVSFPSSLPNLAKPQPLSPRASLEATDAASSTHHLAIFPLSEDGMSCIMQLDIHHAFVDAASKIIIEGDFIRAYAGAADVSLMLATPFSQYVAETEKMATINQGSLAFWNDHITGSGSEIETCCISNLQHAPDLLEKQAMGAEPNKTRRSRPTTSVVQLDLEEPSRAREFCMRNEITLADLFQVAWGLMLRLYTGNSCAYWGYLTSDRNPNVNGIEDMVGLFLNLIVCKLDVDDSDNIVNLLRVFQEQQQKRMQHATCSLGDVQHVLGLKGQRLFNTIVSIQMPGAPAESTTNTGQMSMQGLAADMSTEFEMTATAVITQDHLSVYLHSSFDESQIQGIAQTYANIIQSIVANPEASVGELESLSSYDRQRLSTWNHIELERSDRCAHDLITETCALRGDVIALDGFDGQLTYAELNTQADRLAHVLRERGIGSQPDMVVPLCFSKSIWAIVSMLAVLKAGAAFVHLDPSQPQERLAHIVHQVSAKLMLTSAHHADILAEKVSSLAVSGPMPDSITTPPGASSLATVRPNHLAFVVFTSGSTGQPKGILIEHGTFVSSSRGFQSAIGVRPESRVLQFSAYTFDISVADILTTLIAGGCICIISDEQRKDSSELTAAINRLEVTHMLVTPTVVSLLEPSQVPSLENVVLAGEIVTKAVVQTWGSRVQLRNGYGPAECTILCSVNTNLATKHTHPSSVGSPSFASLWIVDPKNHDRLMPVGAPGELLVAGPTLARGYLNDPEATSKGFIAAPAWVASLPRTMHALTRFYKTGDIASFDVDGSVIVLGRKDNQIKLRGQRIELGEVEFQLHAAMQGHSDKDTNAIAVAADVVSFGTDNDQLQLVGFVQYSDAGALSMKGRGAADEGATAEYSAQDENGQDKLHTLPTEHLAAVRDTLQAKLPSYMIPSIIWQVKDLPKLPSGKLDRKTLRRWGRSKYEAQRDHQAAGDPKARRPPVTPTQILLASLWAQVLRMKVSSILLDSHFITLGGDSVTVIRLVAAARAAAISVTAAQIFQHPILEDMVNNVTLLDTSEERHVELQPFSLLGSAHTTVLDEVAALLQSDISDIEDCYPCTPLQEGVMIASEQQKGAYMAQQIIDLPDGVDPVRFQNAWEQLVADTAVLRTHICHTSSAGCQQVVMRFKKGSVLWRFPSDRDSFLEKDLVDAMGFKTPLSRCALFQNRTTGRFQFIWTVHHAIYDGWTMPIFLQSLKDKYDARPLPHRPEFNSYVSHLIQQDTRKAADFWTNYLSQSNSPSFPLLQPGKIPRSDATFGIVVNLSGRQPSQFTLPTMIRVAWALVLSKYTNSSDVIFGTMHHGRTAPIDGIEGMLGPTLNTLPIRLQFASGESIADTLARAQAQSTDMLSYEHFGLRQIQHLGSTYRRACDFKNLLIVQLGGEKAEVVSPYPWAMSPQSVKYFLTYPLVVHCHLEGEDEMKIYSTYDPVLVPSPQVARMLRQLGHVLQQIARQPNQDLSNIDFVPPEDRVQLKRWNPPPTVAVDMCIHEVIEHQTSKQPDRPAIESFDGRFTYRELDYVSSKLARFMVSKHGIGSGSIVPLCFEKSAWAIVAMLAVLKAGAAFTPLDPLQPSKRLWNAIAEAEAKLVLTSAKTSHLFAGTQVEQETISEDLLTRIPEQSENVLQKVSSRSLAFLFYTSGSTGRPKGILLEHRAFVTSSAAWSVRYDLQPQARVLQFAHYIFDVSLGEIFSTLMTGGCVCVPSEDDRLNKLADSVRSLNATHLFLTPTVLATLLPEEIPNAKQIVMVGEAARKQGILTWAGRVRLINAYGPAETTTWVTCNTEVTKESHPGDIGTSWVGVWLVDPENHNVLAPIGAPGEILIQGAVLARGYLNNPEETSRSFITEPKWASEFAAGDEQKRTLEPTPWRFYKSGDLARYNDDGSLQIIGRKDAQIKMHGQRIEVGEVEFHLRQAMDSANVAVEIASAPSSADQSWLVAFLPNDRTLENPGKLLPLPSRLRETLLKELPAYMVPGKMSFVDALPRLPSGKLDRNALRKYANTLRADSAAQPDTITKTKEPAASKAEKQLRDLWSAVLNIEPDAIARDDHFLELGGDSLSAIRLVVAARRASLAITVADILQRPVLFEMALLLRESTAQSKLEMADVQPFGLLADQSSVSEILQEASRLCDVPEAHIKDIYPATPLQEGFMAIAARDKGAYMVQVVFDIPGHFDLDRVQSSWESTIRFLSILRTRIILSSTNATLQVVLSEDLPVLWSRSDNLEVFLGEDSKVGMAFGEALSRLAVVIDKDSAKRHVVWTAHHSVYDAWSSGLVYQAVDHEYASIPQSKPPPFRRFVKHLLDMNETAAASFWKEYLAGARKCDFPRISTGKQRPSLDQLTRHSIALRQSHHKGRTLSTLLQAAWAILLGRYSETNDVTFACTLSGRTSSVDNIDGIAGPTITTVPVRVRLDRDAAISELLSDIQSSMTEMIPFQHFGLRRIQALSEEIREACSFTSLFSIQSDFEISSDTDSLTKYMSIHAPPNFHPFPLLLNCDIKQNSIELEAVHDSSIIDLGQMRRLCCQFTHIFNQLLQLSVQTVSEISVFSPEDRAEVASMNSNMAPPQNRCIHSVFEDQVARFADSQAICAWDGTLTFAELNSHSDLWAQHLVASGVTSEEVIPVLYEKSMWTTVAILSILKAGAAFTLFDPSHPDSRLKAIIEIVRAKRAIASGQLTRRANVMVPQTVTLGAESTAHLYELQKTRDRILLPSPKPTDTAYVIFTSGSTGVPKGVVIEHASFCSVAAGQAKGYEINHDSRVLQFASYSFGVALLETLTTLLVGGCVCVVSDVHRMGQLTEWIRDMKINWAVLTPSMTKVLEHESVPSLRTLVYGGEAGRLEEWMEKVHLIQAYGQTESSTASFAQRMTASVKHDTIGRPLVGYSWVVDPGQVDVLAPMGAAGELLVEGPHIGRGYIRDPHGSKASFISNPAWLRNFVSDASAATPRRFFRTGDVVRYNSDGTLQYIRRLGTDVKLRGQRIELEDVEHHIKHATKSDATINVAADVITASSGPITVEVLVAFITLGDGDFNKGLLDVTSTIGRRLAALIQKAMPSLADKLPHYMIPTAFLPLENLPYTPSGKLDRKSLKEFGQSIPVARLLGQQEDSASGKAPMSTLEKNMRSVWARVLNVPEASISLETTFQSLGGDSISAIQVVSQSRDMDMLLSVRDLLEKRTIGSLVPVIQSNGKAVVPQQTVEDEDEEDDDIMMPISPIQQLYFDMVPECENHYNLSVILELGEHVSIQSLETAFQSLTQRHPAFRSRFVRTSRKGWLQTVATRSEQHFTLKKHFLERIDDILPIAENSQKSLNIQDGPLLAVNTFFVQSPNCAGPRQFLFITAHHLVMDFVSWRIVLHELEEHIRYDKISSAKPMSFQRWIRLQRKYLSARTSSPLQAPEVPTMDTNYWGMEAIPNKHADAVVESFSLCPETSRLLLGQANQSMNTDPAHLMVASIIYSFAKVFPDRNVPAVFCEGHGRESWDPLKLDISSTVGWFTTLSPVVLPDIHGLMLTDIAAQVKDYQHHVGKRAWETFSSHILSKKPSESKYYPIEVSFNYAGMYQQLERKDALFRIPSEFATTDLRGFGSEMPRFGMIEFLVSVQDGIVTVMMIYNKHMQRRQQIIELAKNCKMAMMKLATDLSECPKQPTPGDYPLLHATPAELRTLIREELPAAGVPSRSEIEDLYPLTPLQEGMLITQIKAMGRYDVRCQWEILGPEPIDLARLERAWQSVVDRHAMLRTVILENVTSSGKFIQVVLRRMKARVSNPALAEDQSKTAKEIDDSGVPITSHELKVVASQNQTLLELHISHLFIDGSSLPILERDLTLAYDDLLPSSEPPRFAPYVRYVNEISRKESLRFWETHLSETVACHFPASECADFQENCSLYSANVHLPTYTALSSFCRSHSLSISDLLETTWSVVLFLYTGSRSPAFGCISADRGPLLEDSDPAIGVFINMLVSRTFLDETSSLLDVLKQVQSERVMRASHQNCSTTDILEAWDMHGSAFDTIFSIQRIPSSNLNSAIQQSSTLKLRGKALEATTEYLISVVGSIFDDKVVVNLDCNTRWISRSYAEQISSTFSAIVQNILNKPKSKLGEINVTTTATRVQLEKWKSKAAQPLARLIHELIYENCSRIPGNFAICTTDRKVTYSELQMQSTLLSSRLRLAGIGPGRIVAICLKPSHLPLFYMLAVLGSGASFILLDHSLGTDTLQTLTRKIVPSAIVTSEEQADVFQNVGIPIITTENHELHSILQDGTLEPAAWSHTSYAPPAFILASSDSVESLETVSIDHFTFSCAARLQNLVVGLSAQSRTLQFSSYMSGLALVEILSTLIAGGCVCIPPDYKNRTQLASYMSQLNVNWVMTTASRLWLLEPAMSPMTIVVSGEPLHEATARKWEKRCSVLQACSAAGDSLLVTCSKPFSNSIPPNFGRPIDGSSAWLAPPLGGEAMVPPGAVGELVVRSPYLQPTGKTSPALSNEMEKENVAIPPGPLKTGYLFRWSEKGNLNFQGLKEMQIKKHGQITNLFHVENQILTALSDHATSIAIEAMELDNDDYPGKTLVAFVCTTLRDTQQTQQLFRRKVEEVSLAIPSLFTALHFVPLQEFPLTWHGKLDRRQLREHAVGLSARLHHLNEPVSDVEDSTTSPSVSALRRLWATVLGLEENDISTHDDFFTRGGTSLSALKLVASAKKANIHLTIHQVFQNPTLSSMAASCIGAGSHASSIEKEGSGALTYRATHDQALIQAVQKYLSNKEHKPDTITEASAVQRQYYAANQLPNRAALAYFSIDLPFEVQTPSLLSACDRLVQRHEILRTVFIPHKHILYQVVIKSVSDVVEKRSCSDEQVQEVVEEIVHLDRQRELAFGEMITRFFLVQGRRKATLIMRMSHAQYDGISLPLLFSDLSALYNGSPLSPCHQFSEFLHVRKRVCGSSTQTFWKNLLNGSSMPRLVMSPSLVTARPPEGLLCQSVKLPEKNLPGMSTSIILKAAWALVLGKLCSSSDVVFGEVITNRRLPMQDIDRVAGPCLNVVPVRISTNATPTGELLSKMRAQNLATIPHEAYELRDILDHCVSWPGVRRFSSVVVHQDLEIKGADSMHTVCLGSSSCELRMTSAAFNFADITVLSIPRGQTLELSLSYDNRLVATHVVEGALKALCNLMPFLADEQNRARIPIVDAVPIGTFPVVTLAEARVTGNSSQQSSLCQPTIERCWERVLGNGHIASSASLFDLGGDIVTCAELVDCYREEGVSIEVADVIAHPSKGEQQAFFQLV